MGIPGGLDMIFCIEPLINKLNFMENLTLLGQKLARKGRIVYADYMTKQEVQSFKNNMREMVPLWI